MSTGRRRLSRSLYGEAFSLFPDTWVAAQYKADGTGPQSDGHDGLQKLGNLTNLLHPLYPYHTAMHPQTNAICA